MNQKLKSHLSKKKAYMQIDYAFTIVFFLIFLFFIINDISSKGVNSNEDIKRFEKDKLSQDICSILTKTSGHPNNWYLNIEDSSFIGLKKVNGSDLDINKLSVLNNNNYFNITDKLNLKENYLQIKLYYLSNFTVYYSDFGKSPISLKKSSKSICYTKINSQEILFEVEVWQ
jgi:hypothetical protein